MAKKIKKEKTAAPVSKKTARENAFGNPVRNLIVTAIVSILLGVAFLVKPALVYTYCGYAIGGIIGLVGIAYIIIYFARKPVSGDYRSEFGIGLVALAAGAYVAFGGYLVSDSSTVGIAFTVIVKIIGVLIAADGVLKLQYAVDLGRMKFGAWWVVLILGVLGIALGVVMVMGFVYDLGDIIGLGKNAAYTAQQNAFISGLMMLGVAFCFNGLLDLIAMILVIVRNHKARRDEEIAEGSAMVAAAKQEEMGEMFPVPEEAPAPAPEPAPEAPVFTPEPANTEPVLATPVEEVQ